MSYYEFEGFEGFEGFDDFDLYFMSENDYDQYKLTTFCNRKPRSFLEIMQNHKRTISLAIFRAQCNNHQVSNAYATNLKKSGFSWSEVIDVLAEIDETKYTGKMMNYKEAHLSIVRDIAEEFGNDSIPSPAWVNHMKKQGLSIGEIAGIFWRASFKYTPPSFQETE